MKEGSGPLLEAAATALGAVEPFQPAAIELSLAPLLERFEVKPGRLYQPIRVAITGSSVSPGIFESLAALGRERSLERLQATRKRLKAAETDG
jgi:glutamyl-tRNA synthetase